MTFSLADLKKSSGTDFAAISKAFEKTEDRADDSEFFKLPKDKAGNGSAVIRFLPKHPDDKLPWVVLYSHSFQGPTGRWYIENCRTTMKDEADYVNDVVRELWPLAKSGDKQAETKARLMKRKTHYIANVFVVSCPAQPELEGQVLRYKFGKKIFEKIMDKFKPAFVEDKPVNVFDAMAGADFKLRMKVVDDYPNYDSSTFAESSQLGGSDDEMLDICNKIKPLNEFTNESNFKSFDDLKKKYESVMNAKPASTKTAEQAVDEMTSAPVREAKVDTKSKPAKVETSAVDEDIDIEDYFRTIAN